MERETLTRVPLGGPQESVFQLNRLIGLIGLIGLSSLQGIISLLVQRKIIRDK